jgi:hypothetical protein
LKALQIPFNYLFPLSFLVFVGSFYAFNPTVETGLDPSYAFGLNYIFAHQIPFGTEVIYTYGPLGFLYFPQAIAHNFLIGVLVVSLLRFLFIVLFIYLGKQVNSSYWLLHGILAFVVSNWFYLDFIFVGAVSMCMLLHHFNNKNWFLILGAVLSIIALLVKSSFGLMSLSILGSYGIYTWVKTKNLDDVSVLLFSTVFFFLLIWLTLYGNVKGVYAYLVGTWQLSTGNSSAMILEVSNNWYLLFCFAACFFSIPILLRQKAISLLYLLSILALLAAWKYAFSREENYHLKFFFDYLILFSALIILLSKPIKIVSIALLVLSLLLLFQSMKATGMYTLETQFSLSGVKNFIRVCFQYEELLKEAELQSKKNLQSRILSPSITQKIGTATIDFFPWELTYVAANKLNWQPRPNLQSGAYTPWLDENNAKFISSTKAASYYLWDMDKPKGGVDCFDNRYFLNDEPFTILTLFNKYQIVQSDSEHVLFKRSERLNFSFIVEGDEQSGDWNKWIAVPTDSLSIIRIKSTFKNNFLGKLRKAIYRDALYFMDYKMDNGDQKTFRIIPENAVNGLWVNPLIERISDGLKGRKVSEIRFRCSDSTLVQPTVLFKWQIITLAENQQQKKYGN